MMSDSDLDDLHQSILSLCGKDITVLQPKNVVKGEGKVTNKGPVCPEQKENVDSDSVVQVIGSKKKDGIIPDITTSKLKRSTLEQSASPLSCNSFNCSDFNTVDETSCSENENDLYTTTVENISACNSSRLDESSQFYHTVDETDGDNNQTEKLRSKNRNFIKGDQSLHLSPIKNVGNDSRFLLSTPATPSYKPSNNFSQFAQSTPLNKLAVTGKAVRQVNNENDVEKEERKHSGKLKKKNKNKSMFEFDDSELSDDMSFDDLLVDTFTMCKGKDIDWKLLFSDTKLKVLRPKIDPPCPCTSQNEDNNTKKKNVGGLSEWQMLYADPKVLHTNVSQTQSSSDETNSQEGCKTGKTDSVLDKTLTEENTNAGNKNTTPCSGKLEKNSASNSDLKNGNENNAMVIPNSESSDVKQSIPSTSQAKDQNISKIKIDSIFADRESQAKDSKQKTPGRFSNFTSSFLSDIEVTEDENEPNDSEDVLGLNNYTYNEADDIDLDEEDEATLLDETITDLPESIKNKYKVHEQISISSKSQTTDANQTVIENKTAVQDVNKNIITLPEDGDGLKPASDQEKEKESDKSATGEVKDEDKENADLQKITGKIDYEAERKYFDIESPEVRGIINLWESKGIQDPDTNLSSATNLRSKNPQEKGLLEGTHITCIWLQESVDAEKECSSPMKKRQKLDSEAHSRRDIANLQQELEEIRFRYDAMLRGLMHEWKYEKVCLEDRHRPVIQHLKYRQLMEMKENYELYRHTNIPLFQMNVIRLHSEHAQQQAECRARFNADIAKLEHLFQRRELEIERNFNHRKAQLESLIEQIKQVKSDGKYGHHVTAQFVKGPCRSNNQTRSLVEVYVPAEVASCILKEDEVIDSFYKYA